MKANEITKESPSRVPQSGNQFTERDTEVDNAIDQLCLTWYSYYSHGKQLAKLLQPLWTNFSTYVKNNQIDKDFIQNERTPIRLEEMKMIDASHTEEIASLVASRIPGAEVKWPKWDNPGIHVTTYWPNEPKLVAMINKMNRMLITINEYAHIINATTEQILDVVKNKRANVAGSTLVKPQATFDISWKVAPPEVVGSRFLNPFAMEQKQIAGTTYKITDRYAGPVNGYKLTGKQKLLVGTLRKLVLAKGLDIDVLYAATIEGTRNTSTRDHRKITAVCVIVASGAINFVSNCFEQDWTDLWHTSGNMLNFVGMAKWYPVGTERSIEMLDYMVSYAASKHLENK
jgi:hypothetical protein